MAMLAEPRRKQKWTLNPRGKQWSDDSNKFGQRMLEKMGWTSGKGLGANEQGMTEHVRVKFKDDAGGIGYSKDDQDKYWTEHQESFNELLQTLQSPETTEIATKLEVKKTTDLSGQSLEAKSKQSRARVHYQKFTRGKDVNKYSSKDLANIFGKKDLSVGEKPVELNNEIAEENSAPIGSTDNTAGVVTIKGGSMNDYFKSKFPNFQLTPRKNHQSDEKSSESESEKRTGFGFSSPSISTLFAEKSKFNGESEKITPKKRKSEFYVETPNSTLENLDNSPKSKKKRKNRVESGENSPEIGEKNENFENLTEKFNSKIEKKSKKKEKKLEKCDNFPENEKTFEISESFAPDMSSSEPKINSKKSKRKKKKNREPLELIPQPSDTQSAPENAENSSNKKNNEPKFAFENPALDLNAPDPITPLESAKTSKKSKKSKKKSADNVGNFEKFVFENPALNRGDKVDNFDNGGKNSNLENCGKLEKSAKKRNNKNLECFENPALDLNDSTENLENSGKNGEKSEKSEKKRKTKNFECFENPALDLENKSETCENGGKFEVSRDPGVLNEALDLTDELTGKKRVTFNDEVEYSTNVTRRKKSKKKLDKFEVESDKLRKNRRKNSTEPETVGFINEALDVEVIDEEIAENEKNERKMEKNLKKRKRRISNLETIEEIPEETENFSPQRDENDVNCDTPKKRRKKERKNCDEMQRSENVEDEQIVENSNKENLDEENWDGEVENSPKKRKKSKKTENSEVDVKVEILEQVNFESPMPVKNSKHKKMIKSWLSRSPILNFAGSNINEIKGYGVDV